MNNQEQDFQEIEKRFLEIEDPDHSAIIDWFTSNKQLLAQFNGPGNERKEKIARIYSSVADSYFKTGDTVQGMLVSKRALSIYKYLEKNNFKITDTVYYQMALWNRGLYLYNHKNYFSALRYLQKLINSGYDERLAGFIIHARYKGLIKVSGYFIIIGAILLIIKYLSVYYLALNLISILLGYIGASLLISAGIIIWLNKKPKYQPPA